jgi:regulator of replication initiation timing
MQAISLEILKIHDAMNISIFLTKEETKIKAIENTIDNKIIEISKIVVHENLKFIIEEIYTLKTENLSLRDELSKYINEVIHKGSNDSSHVVKQIISFSYKYDYLTKLFYKYKMQEIETHCVIMNLSIIENYISNPTFSKLDLYGVAEMLLRIRMPCITENE